MTSCTLFAEQHSQDTTVNYHESSDCIPTKNYLQIFPPKKHLGIENFNPSPTPSPSPAKNLQLSPSLEIWSNPSWEQH